MDRPAIDVDVLHAALDERWARITVVDEDASTNETLLNDESAPDRTVRVAEHQHAGRGRLDRTWTSPPRAGLTFSVVIRPETPIRTWGWLPLLAGVALYEALVAATGVDLELKWPNDLLHRPSGAKLAGILAQTGGTAVIVGIGLNVTTTREELPVETATSLELSGSRSLDRTELLVGILRRLDARLAQWSAADGDAEASGLGKDYRSVCATVGRDVTVTTTTGHAITGRAVGIDPDGRLQVETDGQVESIGAGDVEHLRPGG